MTELKEEHFEVIDANKARENDKKNYKALPYDMFIEESMINGWHMCVEFLSRGTN